ncbi:hypothetical protein XU18_2162 [Perkinsela sp. CCAP 1560/4]|nr:hypothetical protein XU18_2162 [Perkinsela sp. CCAP 1560/4]|eukprot:KNH07117.1 hypothetical protein XU18_2162 [Perkinsela sp. CCAP 1560/4]
MKKATVTFEEKDFILHEDDVPEKFLPSKFDGSHRTMQTDFGDSTQTIKHNRQEELYDEPTYDLAPADQVETSQGDSEQRSHDMLYEHPEVDPPASSQKETLDPIRSEKPVSREEISHRSTDVGSKDLVALEKENARLRQETKRHQSTIQLLREDQVRNSQEIKSLRAEENRHQMEREKRIRLHERGVDRQIEKVTKLSEASQKECEDLRERMKVEKANAVNAIGKWKEALEAERNRFMEGKRNITSLQRLLEEEKERTVSLSQEYEKHRKELKEENTKLSQMHSTSSEMLTKERIENARLQAEVEKERSEREVWQQNAQQEARRRAECEKEVESLELSIKIAKTERERQTLRMTDVDTELQVKSRTANELQERINLLRDEVDQQGSQRRAAEEQLSKYKLSHQSQYEKLCEYHSEIASLRARYEDLQREQNDSLQSATLKQESLKRELDESNNRVASLQHDYDDRVAALQRLQDEHDATRKMLEDYQAQLQRKVVELSETQALFEKERSEWATLRDLHDHTEADLERKLRSLSEEVEKQSKTLQDLQTEHLEAKQEAHSLHEKNIALNFEVETLRETNANITNDLDTARKCLQESEAKVAFLTSTISEEQEKSSNYSQSTNDLSDRLRRRELDLASVKEEARRTREELNGEIFDLRTKLNKLRTVHDSEKSDKANAIREKDVELTMLREEKAHHSLQVKNLTHDLHEAKLENSKQNAAISVHLLNIENLKGKVSAEHDRVEGLRQQLQYQQEETDRKDRETENLRYRMQEMDMRHEIYQKDLVAELQNAREEANVALTNANELKHRIINLEDELNDALNGHSKVVEKHFTELESLRADLQASQSQTKVFEGKLDFAETDVARSENALHQAHKSINDQNKIVDELRAEVEKSHAKCKELEAALDGKIAAHELETAKLAGDLQQAVNDQRTEHRKVDALRKQLTDIEEEIEQQDTAFRHVEKTHLSKILELRNGLASAEKSNIGLRNELSVAIEQSKILQPENVDAVPRSKYERLKNDFRTVKAEKQDIEKALKISQQELAAGGPTQEAVEKATAFIHHERAAHIACRSDLSMCQAALGVACDYLSTPVAPIPSTDNAATHLPMQAADDGEVQEEKPLVTSLVLVDKSKLKN